MIDQQSRKFMKISDKITGLRREAQTKVNRQLQEANLDPEAMDEVMYELYLHQTELEMQHEELQRANDELHNLYEAYWNLYEFAPCGYVTLNRKNIITQVNQAGINILGITSSHLTRLGFTQLIAQDYQPLFLNALQEAAEALTAPSLEVQVVRGDQSRLWVHLDIKGLLDERGTVQQWRITLIDISAQKEAEQAQQERERLKLLAAQAERERLFNEITCTIRQTLDLQEMVEQTVAKVLAVFQVSRVVLAVYNEQEKDFDLVRVAGADESTEAETSPAMICNYSQVQQWFQESKIFPITDVTAETELSPMLQHTQQWQVQSLLAGGIYYQDRLQGVLCLQTCDRVHDWQETEKQLLNDISDQLAIALQQARLYQQLQQELQQRISLQEQLNYNASHDKLTGLGNREKLVKRLEETIQRYQSDLQGKFAVLFLDLNDFKSVNDTFGHTIGDQLLVVVAQRLKNCLREDDLVARFGGDEFVIILEHLENEQGAIEVVHRIHQAIAQSIIINQIELEITTSIGIVFSDPQYTTTDPILRDADIAMYEAKNSSAHYAIFEQ